MKKGYVTNIETAATMNANFRRVLYTGQHMQLVLMALKPREEIGAEVHPDTDQFFRFESGEGVVVINGHAHPVGAGTAVVVPAGARHNVINLSDTVPMRLYTIYAPPHHRDGTIHGTRNEAEKSKERFDGKTTE